MCEFDDIEASFTGFVFAYERLRHFQLFTHLHLREAHVFAHLPQQRA
ncbi:hypothetical protein [Mycobacteroides chelonae]|nr:hypothetical protein [Mycobacteroides chelonae]MBV0917959.1 hypothetical protein [Mycobacteroides chelonae]MEC4903374.1 hypothetical protein [Mycobacteroides chelonae]